MVDILGLARAVRHDRGVAARLRQPTASSVSVSVPIWLTLIRIELAMPVLDPLAPAASHWSRRDRRRPAGCGRRAGRSAAFQPSSRPRPCRPRSRRSDRRRQARRDRRPFSAGERRLALALPFVGAVLEDIRSPRSRARAGRRRRACSRPRSTALTMKSSASRAEASSARSRPRRRPRSRGRPRAAPLFSAWKISAPQRSASAKVGAPTGITMNSWKSIGCRHGRRR